MLVDLTTTQKRLEGKILEEFLGKLFEEQIAKSGEGVNRVYIFLGLNYEEVRAFLLENPYHEFLIKCAHTGRVIEDHNNFNNDGYVN